MNPLAVFMMELVGVEAIYFEPLGAGGRLTGTTSCLRVYKLF